MPTQCTIEITTDELSADTLGDQPLVDDSLAWLTDYQRTVREEERTNDRVPALPPWALITVAIRTASFRIGDDVDAGVAATYLCGQCRDHDVSRFTVGTTDLSERTDTTVQAAIERARDSA